MKNSVNRVDRSSRWWCAKEWQYWQLAGRPDNSLVVVLSPKSRNILVPFGTGWETVSKPTYQSSLVCAFRFSVLLRPGLQTSVDLLPGPRRKLR
jgi:hypothetical protein